MAVEASAWHGLLPERRIDELPLAMEAVLGASEGGGSGSFPAGASDGARWYVKPQNNRQGGRVIITEYVVSRAGALIGAPVCQVDRIRIPQEFDGYPVPDGLVLEEGIASASRAIPDAVENADLLYRERDENRRRHAGVFALYDWCWGGDAQWLYVETEDGKIFSHDHGWYLPPVGADWSQEELLASVDTPHPLEISAEGISPDGLERVASSLEAVNRDTLVEVLAGVPALWPASDTDLEAVGYFLERRAPAVASRMRDLRGKLTGAP